MPETGSSQVEQMRQPRLADMIARRLRERIVAADLPDGAELPSHQDLCAEFGVSLPPIREALRILENEGLVTVRRGRNGGALVHRPTPGRAAFTMGLVLESDKVKVTDLGLALIEQYAICATLCARRENRAKTVVPVLRRIQDLTEATVGDEAPVFERHCREFHDAIISGSGNATLVLVVQSLQALWWSQEGTWSRRVADRVDTLDAEIRRDGVDAHQRILDAIEAGDGELAAHEFRSHQTGVRFFQMDRRQQLVRANNTDWVTWMNPGPSGGTGL